MVKKNKKKESVIEFRRSVEFPPIDELYVDIFDNFKHEGLTISEINSVLPKKIKEYFKEIREDQKKKFSKFTKNELTEYKNYTKFYVQNIKKKNAKFEFKHNKVHELILIDAQNSLSEGRFQRFVRVNSLILLISEFEYFLTRILDLTFSIQPKALKFKDKKISFDDFLDYGKDDVVNKEIDRELDRIMHEDIIDIANILNKKFKLNLKKKKDWKLFSERFYRRNLLVHNRGKINKKYIDKTGRKSEKKYLTVDDAYLNDSIGMMIKYAAVIGNYLIKKFQKNKRTALLNRHQIMCAHLPEEHDSGEEAPSDVFVHHKIA